MRFVDPVRVEAVATGEWLRRAKKLRGDLDAAADDDARREIIKNEASSWQDAKKFLRPVLNRKCWYCETREDRSDNAVDHYRPKSLYLWLAFELLNFRYSCTYCNSRRKDPESTESGGKQDLFPLSVGSPRATKPEELKAEKPLLLDPCVFEDHKRLWFDETGLASLRPRYSGDQYEEARFEESRTLYNLDFGSLRAKRMRKYRDVIDLCREGDEYWRKYEEEHDERYLQEFSKCVVRLVRMIDYLEEHSAPAWHATLGQRTRSVTARHALGIET